MSPDDIVIAEPQIPSYFPRRIIAYLVDMEKISFTEILKNVGISPNMILHSNSVLPARLAVKLIEYGIQKSGKPHLGLCYGASLQLSDLEMLGYAAAAQETVGDALKMVAQHYPVLTQMSQLVIEEENGFFIRIASNPAMPSFIQRFLIEAIASGINANIDRYNISSPEQIKCYFEYEKPSYISEYSAMNLISNFSQSMSGVMVPDSIINTKINDEAYPWPNEISLPKDKPELSDEHKQKLYHYVLMQLPSVPKISDVAKYFGTSVRTFQRKLRADNLEYRQVVEQVRIQEAEMLLKNSKLSIKDISLRLGFSDASTLTRVFKRNKEMTPVEYRRHHI